MKTNKRRHLPGPFVARESAPGAWRLSQEGAAAIEVWVRGAGGEIHAAAGERWESLVVEWLAGGAQLELRSQSRSLRLEAASVIVHEPLPGLYRALPLAALDGRARRFWRRVFMLARIPGGRSLLQLVARRRGRP